MGTFNKTGLQPIQHGRLFVICDNFLTIVLLHLNKVDHLEQLSCTDIEQVWGKRKAKVKELCRWTNFAIAK
ncbi:hypothetical protein MTP99_007590 [Tenebrio molitor]|nr:hypothetical protein MTP99_007590 [Tenebrio molitor]